MPLLATTTGYETFPNASAKVYAFHLPSRAFPGRELNLGIVARSGAHIRAVTPPNSFSAGANLRPELGKWSNQTFDVPDGALVKVFAHRTGSFGQMRIMASVILRMRAQAALRRIGAILTQHERAAITRANFEGRFDVLSVEEAETLGAVIPLSFRNTFDAPMVRRAFEVNQLEAEVTPPQVVERRTVQASDGTQTEVTTARGRRALDL